MTDEGTSPHLRGNLTGKEIAFSDSRDIPAPTGQPNARAVARPDNPGHPRTYGATILASTVSLGAYGTSPHLRGNPGCRRPLYFNRGDIPAPTGQPFSPPPLSLALGTSPHLRGNPGVLPLRSFRTGDIPAPTGQPWRFAFAFFSDWGHPRTYGATLAFCLCVLFGLGTSPHLRGNRLDNHRRIPTLGDIPAPTGQPCPCKAIREPSPGHPRTYGATQDGGWLPVRPVGTSPHLRGNLSPDSLRRLLSGDIPAPTGQPTLKPGMAATAAGHPRTYGATNAWPWRRQHSEGTSPHLRGNRAYGVAPYRYPGDIPAPTGQPAERLRTVQLLPGHPRTYGATLICGWALMAETGTSPHLRG